MAGRCGKALFWKPRSHWPMPNAWNRRGKMSFFENTRKPEGFGGIAGSNRWPLDCQNLTFSGVCIMYSFFKKYRRKIQTKTEKIFLYFLSSIFCFNMTDCIPCFLLYKEFKSGPLFERDLLQNHSNSRLFGYSILSKLVISSCRMHEPKLWFRILLCRDKSCDFVAVSTRRNLWFCHVEGGLFLDKICDSVI